MFGKNKNSFGDKDYKMKEKYSTKNLFVANLQRISSNYIEFGPTVETTKQKYIFEIIFTTTGTKYREIFTGFITKEKNNTVENGCNLKYFDLPYVCNLQKFTDYFPETIDISIPKLSLIWALNDVNCSKEKINSNQLKKNKK